MNRNDQQIWLAESDGEARRWKITFAPLPENRCAEVLFEKRTLVINKALRTKKEIRATLIHEAAHIAGGQVTSEEYSINIERNAVDLLDAIGV